MSYIRSGSNPESLYIFGGKEDVEISIGHMIITYRVPVQIFNGLLKKFHRNYHECPCSYKGLKVEEIWVKVNDKKEIIGEVDDVLGTGITGINEVRIKLSYKDWKVYMWYVTWEYIVLSNLKKVRRKERNSI